MAKKKISPVAAAAAAPASAAPLSQKQSPDKMESLKTLNQLLLKETVERREQVSDLRSRLDHLSSDHSLSSDLERGVTRLVVASRLAELAAEMAAAEVRARSSEVALGTVRGRLESVAGEKDAIKKALDMAILERDSARADLDERERRAEAQAAAVREEAERQRWDLQQRKASIRSLEAEKATMEERIRSTEEALRSANDQLQSIKGEKSELEKDLQQASLESDAYKRDLDAMSRALQTAQEKMERSQAANFVLKEEIVRMQHDFEEYITKFVKEKYELKERIQSIQWKKEGLKQEKVILETVIAGLQERVLELQTIMQEKIALDEKLTLAQEALRNANEHLDFITAEKVDIKKTLDQVMSERDLIQIKLAEEEKWKATVRKETNRLRMEFDSLEKEKERLQLDIGSQRRDHVRKLDGLRDTVKKIEEEKDETDRLRAKQEAEIANLQMEVSKLLSTLSGLQDLCKANTENNAQLQAEKESAFRDLNLKKAEVNGLKLQIEELKKNSGDAHNKLQKIKASLDSLITENKSIKIDFDSLTIEKASLEEKLGNTLHAIEEMEGKARAADKNFGRVLSLLKGTSEAIKGLEEGKENGIGREIGSESELDENIQNIADELVAIVMAFKSRVAKIENMDQELKVLSCAMAEAKKKGGVWTWLYPAASTFLAAVSFAYAAKCH